MTAAVVAVRPEDTVEHAARLMYDRRVKRLPVTDADGRLVGIISRADVLSVFDRTDAAIRHEITHDVLLGEFLADPARFQVTVMDGIVTLAGGPRPARPATRSCGGSGTSRAWWRSVTVSTTRPRSVRPTGTTS